VVARVGRSEPRGGSLDAAEAVHAQLPHFGPQYAGSCPSLLAPSDPLVGSLLRAADLPDVNLDLTSYVIDLTNTIGSKDESGRASTPIFWRIFPHSREGRELARPHLVTAGRTGTLL